MLTTLIIVGCGKPAATPGETPKPADTKPVELRLAHFFPATHPVETEIITGWAKAIAEATDGRVKITSYPAGTLVPAAEIYEGVVQGVADIGISVYAYTRGRFPVIETFLLPGINFNNSKVSSFAAMEGIKKLNPQEIQDVKHLWTWGSGPGDLMMKTTPVRKLEDIRGLEIGATAGPRADGLKMLGATPVILPMGEWYEALSRGIMHGGVAPVETMQGFRLGEVTGDYITLTPFLYNQLFFSVMNLDKWNSLSPDIQKIITETTEKFYAENLPGLWDKINERGLKWAKDQKPREVITLSKEENARWIEAIQPVQNDYVEFLNSRGLPGEEILKTVKEIAEKYNKQYPDVAPYVGK